MLWRANTEPKPCTGSVKRVIIDKNLWFCNTTLSCLLVALLPLKACVYMLYNNIIIIYLYFPTDSSIQEAVFNVITRILFHPYASVRAKLTDETMCGLVVKLPLWTRELFFFPMFIFVPSFWCHCQLMSHEETFRTDLNFNAISQVHGDQVVALRRTVGPLQDFHISLGVGEIQVTRLCGRQSKDKSLCFPGRQTAHLCL